MKQRIAQFYLLGFAVLTLFGCTPEQQKSTSAEAGELSAKDIIDRAIEAAGGLAFYHTNISFDFRDKHYVMQRSGGLYTFKRIFTNSQEQHIVDELSNDGFRRYQNDSLISLADTMAIKFQNSLNSVIYFASLPFPLQDEGVKAKRLEDSRIKNKWYYKIEVTFSEEKGGHDHEDVFYYWFDKETLALQYLAYQFHVDGGGIRFRDAYRTHHVEGFSLADYKNYKPADTNTPLSAVEQFFEADQLVLLSEINLENLQVTRSKP